MKAQKQSVSEENCIAQLTAIASRTAAVLLAKQKPTYCKVRPSTIVLDDVKSSLNKTERVGARAANILTSVRREAAEQGTQR